MKYVVLLGDGMADEQVNELAGKTPLQIAATPNMDYLAANGVIGMARTIPEGLPPGSDVGNLSILGYDPRKYYNGRSPLEAVSMGVDLGENDVAFRCNLVTLSEHGEYEEKTLIDYSSGDISTQEARELIEEIDKRLGNNIIHFYTGIGFKNLLVWEGGPERSDLTPPHDIPGRLIAEYLPKGEGHETIISLMKESNKFLPIHPVNLKRIKESHLPATSIWLWGQGKKQALPRFFDKYGLTGSVISAVDVIKGIGICAGLEVIEVEGATGNIHTNFRGKVMAAMDELRKGKDFVYIHVDAPDEAVHQGELANKVRAIEEVDKMLAELLKGLSQFKDYKIMLLPDHPTLMRTRTHSSNPVPFVIYTNGINTNNKITSYNEETAEQSDLIISKGHELMDYFIKAF
ncbi:cofactor-independent phosphoglycerate mutase [Pelotomaculum terephthalicicum JT]|uniref:cofactor-independent phosphoglycerate mutase n=1 Tax=Pelotomaculum terephthalicicum TaxID=206393 RepID=UPI0009D2B8B3|nr:cofactor-independent phosphoglycerate mutase [Pelotomaculum terephthalicicum]MCG9969783.1 cofactor-independent phosphoglycerate mutase [Pelotomaculum terephthalicicum JT]OPX89144.1 MAG: cofactor-independent phosphoglycerate mutase [Pelotomaculum sp. PtaB.Bin104]OPY61007.1 MAG: cofactor-independent phosphoglycerate mutase [Pelotomaculum sp. PtaU1.Bin065]